MSRITTQKLLDNNPSVYRQHNIKQASQAFRGPWHHLHSKIKCQNSVMYELKFYLFSFLFLIGKADEILWRRETELPPVGSFSKWLQWPVLSSSVARRFFGSPKWVQGSQGCRPSSTAGHKQGVGWGVEQLGHKVTLALRLPCWALWLIFKHKACTKK